MSVTSGKRLEAAERRAQLILLGLDHLRAHPGEISSLDRIAEAAGISRSLLFHYFPTKHAYKVAVVQAAADLLLDVTAPDPSLEPMPRLHASLGAFIGFVDEHHAVYTSLLRGSSGSDDELQRIFDATREQMAARVIEGLGLTESSPLIRTTLRGWIGFVEEATLDYLRNRDIERPKLIALFERALITTLAGA